VVMELSKPDYVVVIVGASGGIGKALVEGFLLREDVTRVVALSRRAARRTDPDCRLWTLAVDIENEASIATAFATLKARLRLVIVATGLLHDGALQPEKSYRTLDAKAMLRSYQVNAIGPALVAKHALPLMHQTGRCVFAALGARVGSIGDNRAGGWHSYRASKAALAMILKNLAIESRRRTPELICISLHPGTVATRLSQPFQRNLGSNQLLEPEISAAHLLSVIDGLGPEQSGMVVDWQGHTIPP
jgi:NAD(P)-dependent dehydrogenase (short-subunit alcohol dehydrogenase family)